jgi:transcription elongation factor GreA
MRNATAFGFSPRLRADIVLNNLVGHALLSNTIRVLSDGTPWRPLTHALDIAEAVVVALDAPAEVVRARAYNIGTERNNRTVAEIAAAVADAVPGAELLITGEAGNDPRSYRVDFARARKELGYEAQWTIPDGAAQLAREYRARGLTQEAFDRLTAELEDLKGPTRAEISQRIAQAREEGDLRENGGYHAAREEQSKAEARILQLEDMLSRARVGETPEDKGVVEAGMEVTVRFAGESDTETFLLGAREVLALDSSVALGVYSPQSPLGSAILGRSPGETAQFMAPNGKTVSVEIVDAKPFRG